MMTANSDRYDDDVIARLTGLTLDPETPPHLAQTAETTEQVANTQEGDLDQEESVFTLRSLVSTKEAGVIIGKEGKNVTELRQTTGVKAGVSKVIQGVHERVLTISGPIDSVAKAYAVISKTLFDNAGDHPHHQHDQPCIRLLVPHQLMGTVIGKAGANIKVIQETSGTKMIVSKEMLPQSTERTIDVVGSVDAIQIAVQLIAQSLMKDQERAAGVILYDPRVRLGGGIASTYTKLREDGYATVKNGRPAARRFPNRYNASEDSTLNRETTTLSIPADMVGCLIGKGGASINHIRRLSNAYISISKEADPATQERVFTISGVPDAVQKALHLLYGRLENEKERRLAASQEEQQASPVSQ